MVAMMSQAALWQADAPDPQPFVRRDGKGTARLELAVKGARCANCISRIEGSLKRLDGVTDARLNLSTGKLSVAWREGAQSPRAIVSCVSGLGFETHAPGGIPCLS